ncbi:MAG TPA: hypothetical protein PK668_13175 [Myxococcota bacterium]|nr:hypothetical protein [Myxococcota bacterium]HRY93579.1 hypothetical protein [Myxococcota bacterium]
MLSRIAFVAFIGTLLLSFSASSQSGESIQIGNSSYNLEDSFYLYELQSVHALGFAEWFPTYKFEIYGAHSPTASPGEIAFGNHATSVTSGTVLGRILFLTQDSSVGAKGLVASIQAIASGEHSTTFHRSDLVFYTSNEVDEFGIENMRLHYDGNLSIGTSTHFAYRLYISDEFRANGIRTEYASIPNYVGGAVGNTFTSGNYGVVIAGGGGGSGYEHEVNGNYATIGGGYSNSAVGNYSVVAGGYSNSLDSTAAVVSGGSSNEIATGSSYAVLSGGLSNSIGSNSDFSFIGGGSGNHLSGDQTHEVIAGGYGNGMHAAGASSYNVIGGGYINSMSGAFGSVISGGVANTALLDTPVDTSILGGYNNAIEADYTLAAGYWAIASNSGSFVWSNYYDGSGMCQSDTSNQFRVCATSGTWFSSNVSAASFTDRTPFPYDLETAYNAVLSMHRLSDDQYDPEDIGSQLDHESLSHFVVAIEPDGTSSRNLSATVSAQNEVIKSLVERAMALEAEISALKAKVR